MSCVASEETICLAISAVVAMTTDLEATASLFPCRTALLTTSLSGACVRCAKSSTHCAVVVDGCSSCDFCKMS